MKPIFGQDRYDVLCPGCGAAFRWLATDTRRLAFCSSHCFITNNDARAKPSAAVADLGLVTLTGPRPAFVVEAILRNCCLRSGCRSRVSSKSRTGLCTRHNANERAYRSKRLAAASADVVELSAGLGLDVEGLTFTDNDGATYVWQAGGWVSYVSA